MDGMAFNVKSVIAVMPVLLEEARSLVLLRSLALFSYRFSGKSIGAPRASPIVNHAAHLAPRRALHRALVFHHAARHRSVFIHQESRTRILARRRS